MADLKISELAAGGDVQAADEVAVNRSGSNFKVTGVLANIVEDTTPQLGGQLDVNGQSLGDGTLELLSFVETSSAVNEITVTNAATANGPTISATGDDAVIDLVLSAKSTGDVNIGGGVLVNQTTQTLVGDNIFEETEQTISFTLGTSNASKHIALNSATAQTVTFPQQSTTALPSGYFATMTNKGPGIWTIAAEGTDTPEGNLEIHEDETVLVKLDAAASPQVITIIGGHVIVVGQLRRDVATVADQDYTIIFEAQAAGAVTNVITESDSGTCTLTGKIETVSLGGTANSVSSTEQKQAHVTANTFAIGDNITFTISANSTCLGMTVQFTLEFD